ncbi:uncharacterized protein (TIGR02677 family) [Breznakia blatticola]|uniref:Uncharacterized protein (TIGR02677 family) n=1 Tax=Breznakia blatticola TaxID=1754012 RepID=A0A4R7ZGT3_9FIRM|nr:TIGR02677 family protein [Breznakia blatticola]TDW16532.1 uncharacterized protein (TIGR02677 family) [Breznakia blatticola]
MEIYEKLIKQVTEVKYLQAENADRYRVIIRHFFNEYESIQYWLFKEDVYEMMMDTGFFKDYTIEKCQSDLEALIEWGNLSAIQDTSKVTTIDEFKNKKYRYQLNEYTVEIERMILRLENLEIEGASLEPTLLERLATSLRNFPKILQKNSEGISVWWRDVNNDFMRLNQNYQDYLKTLNSQRAEELMQSEEFLVYKDHLISYLRNFVLGLQKHGSIIGGYLQHVNTKDVDSMVAEVVAYEMSIPRLDRIIDEEELETSIRKRWNNLIHWFVDGIRQSELSRLYDTTNEVIRKITRYAQQISESKHRNANRKQEYKHIANIFGKCDSLFEAHCLSAQVFGVRDMFHFVDLDARSTDNIDSGVYDEKPSMRKLEPRARIARKTTTREVARDYALEKQMYLLQVEAEKKKQQDTLNELMQEGKITFQELPLISAFTRKMLLTWVSKALQNKNKQAKTEFGTRYKVHVPDVEDTCKVECEDGIFHAPNFVIEFMEDVQ